MNTWQVTIISVYEKKRVSQNCFIVVDKSKYLSCGLVMYIYTKGTTEQRVPSGKVEVITSKGLPWLSRHGKPLWNICNRWAGYSLSQYHPSFLVHDLSNIIYNTSRFWSVNYIYIYISRFIPVPQVEQKLFAFRGI